MLLALGRLVLADRSHGLKRRVFVLLGDGELDARSLAQRVQGVLRRVTAS